MKNKKLVVIVSVVIGLLVLGLVLILCMNSNGKESKLKTDEDVTNMLNSIYDSLGDKLPAIEIMTVDVSDVEQVKAYTGLQSNDHVEGLVVSEPFMSSQAYSVAVVRTDGKADIEKMKQEMLNNIDMRKWICVTAEKLYITNNGNVIFMIMSSEEWAKPVYEEFKDFVDGNIGSQAERSGDLDIDFPS